MKKKNKIKSLEKYITELEKQKIDRNKLKQIIENEVSFVLNSYKKELEELQLKTTVKILRKINNNL